MTVQPTAELTIDLGALVANYRLLQRHAKPARVGAGVKANSYGLGADRAAPAHTADRVENATRWLMVRRSASTSWSLSLTALR